MILLGLLLEKTTDVLLKPIVTLIWSSLKANSLGDGRKSSMTLTLPKGSSVYFIFFFIDFLSFSPIACSGSSFVVLRRMDDPDYTLAISKTHRHMIINKIL